MNNNCQLSEEEIQDLRREMREELEKIQFELKMRNRTREPTGPSPSEHSLAMNIYNWPFDENE